MFKDGEDHESDIVKRKARQALEDTFQDEDDDIDTVKRRAQRALEDTFQDEDDDADKMKRSAQRILDDTFKDDDHAVDGVKRRAHQAREDVHADENDEVEWRTAEAINTGLQSNKAEEIEEAKHIARLVLEQALHADEKTKLSQAMQEASRSGLDEAK